MWYEEITQQLTALGIEHTIEFDKDSGENTILVLNPNKDLMIESFELDEIGEGSYENEESDNFYFEEGKLSITQWVC